MGYKHQDNGLFQIGSQIKVITFHTRNWAGPAAIHRKTEVIHPRLNTGMTREHSNLHEQEGETPILPTVGVPVWQPYSAAMYG